MRYKRLRGETEQQYEQRVATHKVRRAMRRRRKRQAEKVVKAARQRDELERRQKAQKLSHSRRIKRRAAREFREERLAVRQGRRRHHGSGGNVLRTNSATF